MQVLGLFLYIKYNCLLFKTQIDTDLRGFISFCGFFICVNLCQQFRFSRRAAAINTRQLRHNTLNFLCELRVLCGKF